MPKKGKFYPIDEIIKQRTRKGNVEYFVKWKGYSSKSNSWVPATRFRELPKKELASAKTNTKGQSTKNRISKANRRTTKKSTTKTVSIASKAKISSQAVDAQTTRKLSKSTIIKQESFAQTTPTTSSNANARSQNMERFGEVERILGKRIVNSKVEYLVHWKSFSRDRSSWELEVTLKSGYLRMYSHSLRKAFLD